MPIVVVGPSDGQPFGPGMSFHLESTFIGPIADPNWAIRLGDSDMAHVQTTMFLGAGPAPYTIGTMFQDVGDPLLTNNAWLPIGGTARLQIQLRDGGSIVEETNITVVPSYEASTAVLSQQISGVGSQTGGIASIASNVTSILGAVERTFATGIVGKISDLLFHPSPPFMVRELIGDLSGENMLQRTAPGVGVNAFGLTWEVQSYGGGIGLDDSVPVKFEVDLLQIEVRHTLADGYEYASQVADVRFSNGVLLFDQSFPTRVNVNVAPSVVIRFWWLLAGLG